LKIVAASDAPEYTAVVAFCTPMLLKETLDRLDNKTHIKFSGDGTFRLTNGQWILLTVGIPTDHYEESSGFCAARTAFNPRMFAFANKKVNPRIPAKTLCGCAEQCAGIGLS
jgi:hypothetical protein